MKKAGLVQKKDKSGNNVKIPEFTCILFLKKFIDKRKSL